MGKFANAEVLDKRHDRSHLVSASDTNDGYFFTEFSLHLCDRRGFCSANASPGRPEPEHDVFASQTVPVKLAAVGEPHKDRCGRTLDC